MASICPACLIGSDEVSVQMKLFPVRTQALRLPALVLVCLLLVLGAVLGFAVCRAVPQQDRQELSDYLHQYAQATADGRGPSASALSVAAAYFRYPLAAALLGLAGAGRPGRPLGLPPLPGGLPPGRAGRAGPAPAGGPLAGRLPRGRLLICAGVDVDKLVALPRVLLPAFLSQGAFPPFHIPKFFQGVGSPTSRTRAPKDAKFPARFS